MRVVLDEAACVGHGRCYALAPDLFDADDRGHCVVKHSGDLTGGLVGLARTGIANCPEDALSLED